MNIFNKALERVVHAREQEARRFVDNYLRDAGLTDYVDQPCDSIKK